MNNVFQSMASLALFCVMLVAYFPGGTILMAMICSSHRLDGWDWVLSVILPFYGLGKVLFSRAC